MFTRFTEKFRSGKSNETPMGEKIELVPNGEFEFKGIVEFFDTDRSVGFEKFEGSGYSSYQEAETALQARADEIKRMYSQTYHLIVLISEEVSKTLVKKNT